MTLFFVKIGCDGASIETQILKNRKIISNIRANFGNVKKLGISSEVHVILIHGLRDNFRRKMCPKKSPGDCTGQETALLYCWATAQPSPDGRTIYWARRLCRAAAQLRLQGDCAVYIHRILGNCLYKTHSQRLQNTLVYSRVLETPTPTHRTPALIG